MSRSEYICDSKIIHEDVVNKVKSNMPCSHIINKLSNLYKLLGDETRCKILYCLSNEEMCVCDIAGCLGNSKSLVSHQLSLLKKSGIVKSRKESKITYYSLDDEHINEIYNVGIKHIFHKVDNKDNEY